MFALLVQHVLGVRQQACLWLCIIPQRPGMHRASTHTLRPKSTLHPNVYIIMSLVEVSAPLHLLHVHPAAALALPSPHFLHAPAPLTFLHDTHQPQTELRRMRVELMKMVDPEEGPALGDMDEQWKDVMAADTDAAAGAGAGAGAAGAQWRLWIGGVVLGRGGRFVQFFALVWLLSCWFNSVPWQLLVDVK